MLRSMSELEVRRCTIGVTVLIDNGLNGQFKDFGERRKDEDRPAATEVFIFLGESSCSSLRISEEIGR